MPLKTLQWFFLHDGTAFKFLGERVFSKFMDGTALLPQAEPGWVRYVDVQVLKDGKDYKGVTQVQFFRAEVDSTGLHTEQHCAKEAAVLQLMEQEELENKASENVVIAASRFALGQYRWKPTSKQLEELIQIVNTKIGFPFIVTLRPLKQ